jgi:hypothetical protein
LNRTPASAGNRKTWTWSGWVKRGRLGVNTTQTLFGAGNNDGTDGGVLLLYFLDSNVLLLGTYQTKLETTQVFRDPSAWYHIICAVDTTQSGITNQAKLYVNGVQITQFSTSNAFSASVNTPINNTIQHEIGRQANATSRYFDGYLTEVNFIDGSALTPSSFGETDPITGVWTPKKYTGSYGTNGFYLNFSDNSGTTSTTLGKDSSGNGNNWTPNNFSVTAGAGNDSLVDSPTRYGTDTGAGGTVRGNYATLNPLDTNSSSTLSNGNLQQAAALSGYRANATFRVPNSGKWYAEFINSSAWNSNTGIGFGVSTEAVPLNGASNASGSYHFYAAAVGQIFSSGTNLGTISSITNSANQIFQLAVDVDNGKVWIGQNNTWYNSSAGATGDPATGANPTFTISPVGFKIFTYIDSTTTINWNANFGQRPFSYTAPSGFKALVTTNLPEPTIKQGDDYFNAVLWTGDGASTRSITGVGFAPDLVWVKSRSTTDGHALADSVRGISNQLYSNSTEVENAFKQFGFVSNNTSDGFSLSSGGSGVQTVNTNGTTYVAWNWKANGAGSTNTAGTITSTVSVNTTSGFSIVTYTGTGANATVGHGLGVAPRMIIVKRRDASGNNWNVYHAVIGNTTAILLNDISATQTPSAAYWNNTSPTSSVFSLGTGGNGNLLNGTYVAYCFAPVAGYSAFGSYTGNGSTDGPFLYTGFRPRWVLTKVTAGSGAPNSWVIHDTARDTYNYMDKELFPDASTAEQGSNNRGMDCLSNGFKVRSADNVINTSGGTYIYAAFAENPFAYSLAR